MLDIQSLSFSYPAHPVIKQLCLHVNKGEIVSILGRSGCGKTTLFRLLSGLEKAQTGSLSIQGHAHPRANSFVSYMMQNDLLLPWRTCLDNVLLLEELGLSPPKNQTNQQKAKALLKKLKLSSFLYHYPHELSGGMRQRVSFARCLLQDRPLLLLDEPFGALDFTTRQEMYSLIKNLREQQEKTIVLITHDLNDAISLSDKIFYLNNGKLCREWVVPKTSPFSLLQEIKKNI